MRKLLLIALLCIGVFAKPNIYILATCGTISGATSDKNSLNKGVMVIINNEIHQARDVTKTNTSSVATFKSLNFGKIGSVNYAKVDFTGEFYKKHTINSDVVLDALADASKKKGE